MGWLAGPEDATRASLQLSHMALLLAVGRRDATAATAAATAATAARQTMATQEAGRAALLAASESRRHARDKVATDFVEVHRKDPMARPPAALLSTVDAEFAVSEHDFRWGTQKSKASGKVSK